jgi:hypothetical protein
MWPRRRLVLFLWPLTLVGCEHDRGAPPVASAVRAAPNRQPLPPISDRARASKLDAIASEGAGRMVAGALRNGSGWRPASDVLAGQFEAGQVLVDSITAQPGGCYLVQAVFAEPVAAIELSLAAEGPLGERGQRTLSTVSEAEKASIDERGQCLEWTLPEPGKLRVVLEVRRGQGVAAAQIFRAR